MIPKIKGEAAMTRWKVAIGTLIALIALSLGLTAYAQKEASPPPAKKIRVFNYSASKFGLRVIRATMRIEEQAGPENKTLLQTKVSFFANSPSWETFFRFNNHFTSLVETGTGIPLRYSKVIDQDGIFVKSKHYTQTLTFNIPQHKVIVEHSDVKEKQVVNLPPDTYDPLAMFARYYLKEGLLPEEDFKISIYDGIKFRTMVFRVKREQVESKLLGKVDAIVLESNTPFSTFGDKDGTIRIWYTRDERKIPLAIELELPVGTIKFNLESIEDK
jgi:hypothetical protein